MIPQNALYGARDDVIHFMLSQSVSAKTRPPIALPTPPCTAAVRHPSLANRPAINPPTNPALKAGRPHPQNI